MIGIIAAVSQNGVIGVDNKIPWDYPADMKYFRTTTANSTIVFGRKTFESIGRALPKRRNIVISSQKINIDGIETFPSIQAMKGAGVFPQPPITNADEHGNVITIFPSNLWFAGGARIYEEAMEHAEEIHLTTTPDVITRSDAVRFPWINPRRFGIHSWQQLTLGDDTLRLYVYKCTAAL
jgi:dihydrofolate reductase